MLKIFITLLAVLLGLGQPAAALTSEQRRIIDSNIGYFDVEEAVAGNCGSSTSNSLVGSENAEKIWNYLISKSFQPPQVAGIMGNFQAESGFNPRRVQNTKTPEGDRDYFVRGKGYGLAQWTSPGRQDGLADMAKLKGTIHGDLGTQLDFFMQEFSGPYASVQAELRATTDVNRASDIIMTKYERPADQSEKAKEKRRVLSRDILARYGSSTPVFGGSSTGCGSGQVVNGYSLPVDQHWYDEHPQRFQNPHHDYPASDISLPSGTNVYSMSDGIITLAPTGGSCGNGVIVDAGNGVQFIYCHGTDGGSITGARLGDTVAPGQLIMHSDNTGNTTGPHLHVQIKVNGQNRCPQPMFKGIVEGNPPSPQALPSSGCTY